MTEKEVLKMVKDAGWTDATVVTPEGEARFLITVRGKTTTFSSYFAADKIDDDLENWLLGLNENMK